MILRRWGDRIESVDHDARDAKTALQEWAQARKLPPPTYILAKRTGPDHAPSFTIRAEIADGRGAEAVAGSKRAAEQAAAKTLLGALDGSRK